MRLAFLRPQYRARPDPSLSVPLLSTPSPVCVQDASRLLPGPVLCASSAAVLTVGRLISARRAVRSPQLWHLFVSLVPRGDMPGHRLRPRHDRRWGRTDDNGTGTRPIGPMAEFDGDAEMVILNTKCERTEKIWLMMMMKLG